LVSPEKKELKLIKAHWYFFKRKEYLKMKELLVTIIMVILYLLFSIVRKRIEKGENTIQGGKNMETKICKYCRSEIDKKATVCPVCKKTLNFSILRVLIVVLIVIGIFFVLPVLLLR